MGEYRLEIQEDEMNGYVKMNVPSYLERVKLMEQFYGPETDEDGEAKKVDLYDDAQKSFKLVSDHLIEVCLETCNGDKVSDLESLTAYRFGVAIMKKVAGILVTGVPLEKPSRSD